jgi:hypothetical protein
MKWLVSLLLLTAFAFVVPCAGAQTVPLQTSDDLVGDAVETTGDALADLSEPVSLGDSTAGLVETASATQEAAADALGSITASAGTSTPLSDSTAAQGEADGTASQGEADGTASQGKADGTASPGKAFRTKFDRLPPRLERLLERIELGRNVRANLRRLEQALASLSVRERARLLRLLNAEIRRLRADGVSTAERRRIARLVRARATITAQPAPTPTSAVADASTGTPATAPAPGAGGPSAVGTLGASVSAGEAPPRDGAVGPSAPSGIPGEGAFSLTEVLLALGAVAFVIVTALAIKEERAA